MQCLSLAVRPALDLNARMASTKTPLVLRAKPIVRFADAPSRVAGASMVLQRERLHALLAARLPGAVWLHGPTGAGKTVLLRSWVQRAGLSVMWLTADERHNDPAALFSALTALAEAAGVAQLPAFSPEHRDDAGAFAARYFERLDAALPADYALVIDDTQWLAGATGNLLGHAIDACGGRRALCFASQLLPDCAFAPHIAGSRLWIVGYKVLAFDTTEAGELAGQLGAGTTTTDALVGATDGWAAGLMLAMQLAAAGVSSSASADPLASVRTPLAQLIAGQVLGGVARDDLGRLRLLAELPQVPVELATKNPDWAAACGQLQRLAERGLFVERLASDLRGRNDQERRGSDRKIGVAQTASGQGCWRLHDLLRSALREPGAIAEPAPEVGKVLVEMLLAIDRLDLAWQLAARLGATTLDRVVTSHGSEALRRPERVSFRQFAAPLATEYAPRIALWQARALLGDDDDGALAACDAAHRGFMRDGNAAAMRQVTALALLICFGKREDLSKLGTWRERFECAEKLPVEAAQSDLEPVLLAAKLVCDLVLAEGESSAAESAVRQDALLTAIRATTLTPNETVFVATTLVTTLYRMRRLDDAEVAIAMTEATEAYGHAAVHVRALWKNASAYLFVAHGLPDRARGAFRDLLGLAESNALRFSRVDALIGLARLDLAEKKLAAAKVLLDDAEAAGKSGKPTQQGYILHLKARFAMAVGKPNQALQFLEAAERVWTLDGFPKASMLVIEMDRVQVLYTLDRHEEALLLADGIAASGVPGEDANFHVTACMLRCTTLWDTEREKAEEQLKIAVQRAERIDFINFLRLVPDQAGLVAQRALERNLSTTFMRRAIRSRCLPAPSDADARWPWALRVEMLGAFRLVKNDEAIVFSGKAQQKPLDLLKFLACERGMSAEAGAIGAALWPDSDVAAAKKSVEVTVSRLRKLLGDDALVEVSEGRVRLNAGQVWSDAQALWTVCLEAETLHRAGRTEQAAIDIGERLLRAYPGDLLAHEDDGAWRAGARERYRNAFVRGVRALARYWSEHDAIARAVPLLEAAVARDPLAEALHQLLIAAYVKENQPAEAMRVYRQCRQMLSVLIGVSPSPETERLRMSIDLQQGSFK